MALDTQPWTLEMLHRLPDDGNKYELVRGELFVTPPPAREHETILALLTRVLVPYVDRHNLGLVYHAKAVVRFQGNEVEPDLMVRDDRGKGNDWEKAPLPILLVEVLSPSTRRRDLNQKRELYADIDIAEYWVIDPEKRVAHVFRGDAGPRIESEDLVWHPKGATEPLTIDLPDLFVDAGL